MMSKKDSYFDSYHKGYKTFNWEVNNYNSFYLK